eukprot:756153-Hanusia_phi.AAC.3
MAMTAWCKENKHTRITRILRSKSSPHPQSCARECDQLCPTSSSNERIWSSFGNLKIPAKHRMSKGKEMKWQEEGGGEGEEQSEKEVHKEEGKEMTKKKRTSRELHALLS